MTSGYLKKIVRAVMKMSNVLLVVYIKIMEIKDLHGVLKVFS